MGITGWYWLLFDLWLSFAMEIIAGRMGMSTEIKGFMFALPHQYQSGNRVGIKIGTSSRVPSLPFHYFPFLSFILDTSLSHSFNTSL
jgi:hypothetical protein